MSPAVPVFGDKAERFIGDDTANAMLDRKRRASWQLPKV